MAERKKTFMLYADMIGVFKKLPDDKAGQLIKHIFDYVNDKNPETDDLLLSIAFEPIKAKLKRDLKAWERKCGKNKENALIRWNKDNAVACDGIIRNAKHADKDKDKDKDKEKNNIKKGIFIKPSLQEIKSYCLERNNNVDAEKWFDFYESKGWMIGKNKMKDWKAAVRTWEKNQYVEQASTGWTT